MEKDANKDSQKKSKNLHKPPLILSIFRFIFKYIGRVFPTIIGRWSYHLWFLTHRSSTIPKREESWLSTVTKIEAVNVSSELLEVDPLPVKTYFWENSENENAPIVMLIHGWTGRGSQMGAFAEPLLQAGFSVLSFDSHAHGETPGKGSTIFKQSAVQRGIAEKCGPIYAVIAHSFGGMVTPYSLANGMQAKKVVCLSPPSRFNYLLERFSNTLHLPSNIQNYMVKRFKEDYGEDLAERVSSTTTSKELGHIPVLIIHDEDDTDVPISESELLQQAWPNATFKRTKGLGHRRILYNEEVIARAVKFLGTD